MGFHTSWVPKSFAHLSPTLPKVSKHVHGMYTVFVKILLGEYVQKGESFELFAKMPGHTTFCVLHSLAVDVIEFTPQLILCFLVFLKIKTIFFRAVSG